MPTISATPVTVANRLDANQCPASFMQVTNATPTAAAASSAPPMWKSRISSSTITAGETRRKKPTM